MNHLRFRPRLSECEDRLTPAVFLDPFTALSQEMASAATLQMIQSNINATFNPGIRSAFQSMLFSVNQTAGLTAVSLAQEASALQSQAFLTPGLSGFLAPIVGQFASAAAQAQANAVNAQFLSSFINAGNNLFTPGLGTFPVGLSAGTLNAIGGFSGSTVPTTAAFTGMFGGAPSAITITGNTGVATTPTTSTPTATVTVNTSSNTAATPASTGTSSAMTVSRGPSGFVNTGPTRTVVGPA